MLSASPAADRENHPLVSLRGLLLALAAAVLLSWPMLILSAPLMFSDSAFYIKQGSSIWHMLTELVLAASAPDLETAAPSSGAAAPAPAAASATWSVRSAPYPFFAYISSLSPLGLAGTVILQSAAVFFMLFAVVRREFEAPAVDVALVVLACGTLTSLPWFTSYLMPDFLAAAVILYAAVLVRSFDTLSTSQRVVLGLLAAFAIGSHYGHMPLAVACIGAALAFRLWQRRLGVSVVIAAVAPVVAVVAFNAAVGMAVFDGASAAPRRLPVLLARSIEDGPARLHLEAHCTTARYTICEVFPEIPSSVDAVMWSEGSLLETASPEQMNRIREEEFLILWRAFLDYPLQQTWSLIGNTVEQFVSVGTRDFLFAEIKRQDGRVVADFNREHLRGLLDAFGLVHAASVVFGLVALAMMAWADRLRVGRWEREVVMVVLVGLLANAAIFGGLSAPADRYQSRVAWLVPVMAGLFWLERRRQRAISVQPLAYGR